MKRLLLLFILFPIILSAQEQAHGDTNPGPDAAINLQSMASSMSNDQCTKVADIQITHNGAYTTMVVFLHDTTTPGPPPKLTTAPEPPADTAVAEESTAKVDIAIVPPKATDVRMPVAEMHLSAEGYSLLEKLEGYSPTLYNLHDGGYTIGFGFLVPYNEGGKWGNGISWAAAEDMMQQKVPAYEAQVKQYVNVPITQNEFDALTMLAYNLGGFSKATSIINDVNEQVDIDKLQHDWKRFVHSKAPNVSKGLMNRRKDEIEVRKVANYQPDRKIQIFKSRR